MSMFILKTAAAAGAAVTLLTGFSAYMHHADMRAVCGVQTTRWMQISRDVRTLRAPDAAPVVALTAARVQHACGELPVDFERAPAAAQRLAASSEIQQRASEANERAISS